MQNHQRCGFQGSGMTLRPSISNTAPKDFQGKQIYCLNYLSRVGMKIFYKMEKLITKYKNKRYKVEERLFYVNL